MKDTISTTAKPIGLASDHAGFELKQLIINLFNEHDIEYMDFGTYSSDSVDYPDFGHKLGSAIDAGDCDYGIAICGSGNGINMTVNKHEDVRGALCWTPEIAQLARLHNDANVLTLPARFISTDLAFEILRTFFNTPFEGGRHQDRVRKIKGY